MAHGHSRNYTTLTDATRDADLIDVDTGILSAAGMEFLNAA